MNFFNLVYKISAVHVENYELSALEDVNISKPHVLCLMSPSFEENLFIVMEVKTIYPELTIIARTGTQKEMQIYESLNIRHIEPKSHGAEEIYHLLETSLANELKLNSIVKQSEIAN